MMRRTLAALVIVSLCLGGVHWARADDEKPGATPDPVRSGGDIPEGGMPTGKAHPLAKGYSPFAARAYPTRALWGDTHFHTSNSGDAFMGGNRLSPEQGYRFARGETVTSSSGVEVALRRPLDFLVVTDHAEGLGIMQQVFEGNPAFMTDNTLKRWSAMMKAGGAEAAEAANEVVVAQGKGTLPPPLTDPKVAGPVFKSVWQASLETAERFNDPGTFTALLGYEWTSVPGGNNLHRNVIFRDGIERVGKILPFSSWQSEDPEDLWVFLDGYEKKTGGRALAIPHNGNLSNGLMFALVDMKGKPLTADYAKRRQQYEPLFEIAQTKGASEVHPLIAPDDEFADWGISGWDNGNLSLTDKPETPEMLPFQHYRPALSNGLRLGTELGTNPFKFGAIGGTDVHNTLSAIESDNYFGKLRIQEPAPKRWEHVSKRGFGSTRQTWQYLAASRAAVWATENTREAIWDAMMRREVYATSGPRITLRFFGGWEFGPKDVDTRYVAGVGYTKGVPMGGDLKARTRGEASSHVPDRSTQGPDRGPTWIASRSSRDGMTRKGRPTSGSSTSHGGTRSAVRPAPMGSCPRWGTRSTLPTHPGPTRSAIPNSAPYGRIRTSTRRSRRSTTSV